MPTAYADAKKNGQKIYFMQDVIVLPTSLKNSRSDIQSSGKIDIRKAETQKVMDYMYDEMFTDFCDENGTPLIDGIYVRYGESSTEHGASVLSSMIPTHTLLSVTNLNLIKISILQSSIPQVTSTEPLLLTRR